MDCNGDAESRQQWKCPKMSTPAAYSSQLSMQKAERDDKGLLACQGDQLLYLAHYLAVSELLGSGPITRAVDLWSLLACFWWLAEMCSCQRSPNLNSTSKKVPFFLHKPIPPKMLIFLKQCYGKAFLHRSSLKWFLWTIFLFSFLLYVLGHPWNQAITFQREREKPEKDFQHNNKYNDRRKDWCCRFTSTMRMIKMKWSHLCCSEKTICEQCADVFRFLGRTSPTFLIDF